jgi:hypothetical protein
MTSVQAATQRLQLLIGEWSMRAAFPGAPVFEGGSATFEWMLDGRYVVQRTQIPHPEAPDAFTLLSVDPRDGSYTQHYFDSRGVTRVYAMTLSESEWTLTREQPDFSPLDFSQRFIGSFGEDHRTIDGRWETRRAGSDWQLDFGLTFTRSD